MHCHNDFHSLTGMMVQLVESPKKVRDTVGTFETVKTSTGYGITAYDPPTGKASKTDFDDIARQAWHNGMNLFVNYWMGQ